MEEIMLLREPEIVFSDDTLADALGTEVYALYAGLLAIAGGEFGFATEWRYYKDGKAWLCKITHRKNTILWLSAWEGFLKVTFYFTDKTRAGIEALDIALEIKSGLAAAKPIGRLIPLTMNISRLTQLGDFRKIVAYKKQAK